MKLKYTLPILLLLTLAGWWFLQQTNQSQTPIYPAPSTGETIIHEGGEDGDNQAKREAWFELMHSAAEGTNWRAIEYETSLRRHRVRSEQRAIAGNRSGEEDLADGNLTGEWFERGSRNQAGSVHVTEYDAEADMIWLISDGGTLFKGPRSGNEWEVINQDLRFASNLLKFVDTDNGRRLLAITGDKPHYSDDDGLSWTPAFGISVDDRWADCKDPIVIENDSATVIYVLSKPSYWENYKLYKSSNLGESYQAIFTLGSSDQNKYKMVQPHHSNEIYLLNKSSETSTVIHWLNQETNDLEIVNNNSDFGLGNIRANLTATQIDTTTRFYVYNNSNEVFQSEDLGASWTFKGQLMDRPWSVGLYVLPSDPDFLMAGAVECDYSEDGGITWNRTNNWWDYYGDVDGSLHADMMYFNEFQTQDGTDFILNSNHGGLNISYNKYSSVSNLGLSSLNVSQYYDVVTDPVNPSYIYAGTQDQGFQRALAFSNTNVLNFDQVISGDYGHIVFSDNGTRMWTVYPGGWVTYYHNPHGGGVTASWEVDSDNETVWIPPLMSSPDPAENAIYLAGGNMEGGEGSYLIKLTYNNSTNALDTAQIDYDFHDYSGGGTIAMMRNSPVNPDYWYVSTTNGRFFYSYDGGLTWDQSITFVPEGHYLYGSAIYPSKLDANTIYFGGSGYSNPAVYKSTDGGENFTAMNAGMPETLVFEIAANEDESMFFAATEAGPYVYIVAEERWYDMSGLYAPNQTYWSVEYLEDVQTVRFGTYGRGIWDFQISENVATEEVEIANESIRVFPNPTTDLVNVQLTQPKSDQIILEISTIEGKRVLGKSFQAVPGQEFQEEISLQSFPKGNYIITLRDGNYLSTKQVVLQ